MVRCRTCGTEHELKDLEPTFGRPDEIIRLRRASRVERATENNDVCQLAGTRPEEPTRYFVRCILPVALTDLGRSFNWGLWVEIEEVTFQRVWDLWDDPAQASEPAIAARLANRVPLIEDTLGVATLMRLTSPKTRPALTFSETQMHPFAVECRIGVSQHRLLEYLEAMR